MAGQASTSIVIDIDTNKAVSNLNDLSARAEKLYETMSKFGSEKFLEEEYKGLKSGIEALVKSAENAKTTFEKITLFTKMDALVESADKYNAKVREFNSNLNETDKKLEEISSISFKVDNIEFSNRKGIQNQLKSLQDLCEKESKKIKLNIGVEDVLPKQIKNVVDNYKKSLKEEIKKQIDSGNFEATVPLLYEYKVASKGFDGRNNQFKEFDEESIKSFSSIKKSELITIYKDMTDDQIKQIQNLWKTSANNLDLSEGIAIVNSKLSEAAGKIKVGSSGANGKGLVLVDNSVADNAGDQIKELKDRLIKEYEALSEVIDEKNNEAQKKAQKISNSIVDIMKQIYSFDPKYANFKDIPEEIVNRNINEKRVFELSNLSKNDFSMIDVSTDNIDYAIADYQTLLELLTNIKDVKSVLPKSDFDTFIKENGIDISKINTQFKELYAYISKDDNALKKLETNIMSAKGFQDLVGEVFGSQHILPEFKGTGTGSGTGSGSGDSDYNNSDVEALNDRVNEISDELSRKDEKIKELEDQVDGLQSSTQNGKGSGSGTGTGGTGPVSGTGVSPEEMNQLKTKLNSIEQTVGELKAKVENLDPQSYSSAIETINTINNNINSISDSIDKLPKQNIDAEQIEKVNNTLNELKNTLDGLGDLQKLKDLSDKLDDISQKVNTLYDNLVKLQDVKDAIADALTPIATKEDLNNIGSAGEQAAKKLNENAEKIEEAKEREQAAANKPIEVAPSATEPENSAISDAKEEEKEAVDTVQQEAETIKKEIDDIAARYFDAIESLGKANSLEEEKKQMSDIASLVDEIEAKKTKYKELTGNSLEIGGYDSEEAKKAKADAEERQKELTDVDNIYKDLAVQVANFNEAEKRAVEYTDIEKRLERLNDMQTAYTNILDIVKRLNKAGAFFDEDVKSMQLNYRKKTYGVGDDLSDLDKSRGIQTLTDNKEDLIKASQMKSIFDKYTGKIKEVTDGNIKNNQSFIRVRKELEDIQKELTDSIKAYEKVKEIFKVDQTVWSNIEETFEKGKVFVDKLNKIDVSDKQIRNLGSKQIEKIQNASNKYLGIPIEKKSKKQEDPSVPDNNDIQQLEKENQTLRDKITLTNEEISRLKELRTIINSGKYTPEQRTEYFNLSSRISNELIASGVKNVRENIIAYLEQIQREMEQGIQAKEIEALDESGGSPTQTNPVETSTNNTPADNTTLGAILTEVKSINGKMDKPVKAEVANNTEVLTDDERYTLEEYKEQSKEDQSWDLEYNCRYDSAQLLKAKINAFSGSLDEALNILQYRLNYLKTVVEDAILNPSDDFDDDPRYALDQMEVLNKVIEYINILKTKNAQDTSSAKANNNASPNISANQSPNTATSAEAQAASEASTAEVQAFKTIDDAVIGLTKDINTKTEAIRAEATEMVKASQIETSQIGKIVNGVIKLKQEIESIPKISVTGKNTKAEPINITAEISDEQVAKIRQKVLDAFSENNPIPVFFKPNVQSIKDQINEGLKDGLEKLTIQSFDFENATKDMKKTLANAMSDVGLQFDTKKLRLDIKTAVNAARDAAESAGRGNPTLTASGAKNSKSSNIDPKKLDRLYASFEKDVAAYYHKNTLILRDEDVDNMFSSIMRDVKKQSKSKENLDVLYRRFSEAQIAAINKGLDFNADKSDIGTAVINKGYETLISQINKYLETNTKIIGSQFEEEFSKLLTDAKKPALLRTDVDLKQLGAEFARIKNYADEAGLVGNVSKENEEQNKLAKRYFDLGLKMREFRQNNDKFSIDKDLISEFEDIFNKVISSYETRSKEDISDLEKRFSSLKMAIPADLMGSSEKDSIETSIINKSYDKLIDQVRNYLAENTKIVGSKLETEFFNLLNDAKKNIDQRTNADFRQLDAEFARLRQEAGNLGLVGNVSKENTDNNNLDKSYIDFANSMRNYHNANNKIDQDSNLLAKFNDILNRVTSSTQHSKEELSGLKKEFAELQSNIPSSLMGTFEQEAMQTSNINKGYENLITQIGKYLETNTKIQGSKLEEDFNSLLANAKKATTDRNSIDLRQLDAEFARLKNLVTDAGLGGNVDDEVKKASKLDRGYATLALDMKKFHEENNKFDKNTEWADRFNQLFSNITGSISRSDVELEDFRAQFVNFKNEIPRDLLGSTVTSEFFENLKGYDIDSIAKIFEKQSGQVKSKLLGDKYGFESPKMTRDVSQMLDAQADRLTGLINQDNVSDNDIDSIVQHNKQLNNLISTYQTYSEKRRVLQEQISKDGSNAELQQLLQESNVLSNSQVYDAEAMKKWSERYVETINNLKNAQIDAEKEERNNRSTSAQQNQYKTLTKDIEEATATAQRFKEQYASLLSDGLNNELNKSINDMSTWGSISIDLSNSDEIITWNDESEKLLETWTAIQERIKASVVASGQAGDVITATMDYSQYTRKATNALNGLNNKYKDKLTDKQSAEFEQRLEAIRNKIKAISDDTSKYEADNVQEIENDIQQLEKLADAFVTVKGSEDKINSMIRQLSNARNSIERRGTVAQPVVSSIDSEIAALEELKGQNLDVGDPAAVQAFIEKLNEADTTVNKLKNDAEQIRVSTNATASVAKLDSKFNDLLFKVDKFKRDNSKITSDKGISAQFDGLLRSIQTIEKSDVNFQKLNAQFNQLKATVQGKGLTGRSLGDELKYIAEKIGIKALLGNSIYRVIGAFRQMVGIVTELDTGMTTLRRVTDEVSKTYQQFLTTAGEQAHELGSTVSGLVDSTGDFARLGYNIQEANALAKNAVMYSNVGWLDIQTATADMTSTMKAFNITAQDSIRIVDTFDILGKKLPLVTISVKGWRHSRPSKDIVNHNICVTTAGDVW